MFKPSHFTRRISMTHRSFKLTPLALILVALALVGAGCGNEESPTVSGENTAAKTD